MKSSSDRGSAAVEFALVLPLLLMVVLGIVEFGLLLYREAMLATASREGARAGVVLRTPKPTAGDIQAVVQNVLANAGVSSDRTSITVTGSGGSFGTDLTVVVEQPYRFLFLPNLVPGMKASITLVGKTVMKNE